MNPIQFIRAYIGVGRLEYLPAEAPGLFIPLFLGATVLHDFLSLPVLEGILTFALLYVSGFLINSLTDIEVDQKYKTFVSRSVGSMGKRMLTALLIGHVGSAVLLTLHIAYQLGDWLVIPFVLFGIFMGLGYSIKPFHFKVRGPMHVVALSLSAFFIPAVFLYRCMATWPTIPILVIFIGFALAHYGLALANQSGDVIEDRESGLKTPAVRWGLTRTLGFGVTLAGVGFLIMSTGLIMQFLLLDTTPSFLFFIGLFLIPLGLALGYFVPVKGMVDLIRISMAKEEGGSDLEERKKLNMIKKRMHYPKWQASGIYSLFAVSILLFATSLLFTASNSPGPEMTAADYSGVKISDIRFSSTASIGVASVSVDISVNETHNLSALYITAISELGQSVLDNKSIAANTFLSQAPVGRPATLNFNLKVHDLNDTRYSFELYLIGANGLRTHLDKKVIEPSSEVFITNITYLREPGVLKDVAYLDILVYNRLVMRPEGSLTVTIYGSLLINTVSVNNNASVAQDSYWHLANIRLDLPKGPASYKVVVYYNNDGEDTESLYVS